MKEGFFIINHGRHFQSYDTEQCCWVFITLIWEFLRTLFYSSLTMRKNEPWKWEKAPRGCYCHKVELLKILIRWWHPTQTGSTAWTYFMWSKSLAAEIRVHRFKCIPFFLRSQIDSVIDHLIFLKWRNLLSGYMHYWVLVRSFSGWWTAAFSLYSHRMETKQSQSFFLSRPLVSLTWTNTQDLNNLN